MPIRLKKAGGRIGSFALLQAASGGSSTISNKAFQRTNFPPLKFEAHCANCGVAEFQIFLCGG